MARFLARLMQVYYPSFVGAWTASFLSGTAQQFAPEIPFCCSKIHIVLMGFFFKCNLFEKLQYDRVSKHMINKMCFASFSTICNNVGLRDNFLRNTSCILSPS